MQYMTVVIEMPDTVDMNQVQFELGKMIDTHFEDGSFTYHSEDLIGDYDEMDDVSDALMDISSLLG